MIGNRFYTWFKNYYQWVGGAFNETLLLPLVRATAGLRAGAIRYDEATNTVETYDGTNWNAIPSASGFVPYTGATQDVNLGEQGLEAGYLQLDTTPTGTPADQGTIYWDIDAETAALIMNGTVQKVGEDVFFHVQNKTGSPIPKGTAVRFAGTDGNSGKILIAPFLANGTYPSQYFMGVTSETIANDAFGKVYHFGKIRGVNTQAYNAGDILYASTSVAGGFQTTPPVAPNNIIVVAAVISKANNGTLMIRSTLGSNINNDEGVLISGAANGQGLFYENGLWKNKTIATVLGYTPGTVSSVGIVTGSAGTDINVSGSPVTVSGNITFNIPTASATNRGALSAADWTTFNNKVSASRQLTINGTAFDLSADRTWSVGTVTSVAASAPLSVSGSATTTPVITISQANSTTNGFLSSTDWNTFNNKQNALTLTTTGNSGASTLVGATLNVPEYTISGLGGVPTTRTLTINGTALDLSTNRSWSVGTVTSVGLTSATSGVTITDSPVTVSGTIGIAIATANGSQQGLLSGTDWTTFNNKQNTLSLTTNGTSGAASLIGATLNVPQYQAQGNYITSLTGEATASGPGAASVTLSTTAVTGKLLTGLNLSGGGTIAATDSILTAFGKVQNQISAMVGGVMYQGTWNASTNTPALTSSIGVKGYYYIVDVSGTTTLNGISDWRVGDWAIFNGSTWDKVDNTDAVSSVNGFTGAVSLTTSHIAEGTNLYYTDTRARNAISLTTTGNSGAATYSSVSGIINVPQYTLAGLGGVPTTRQLTINGTAFDLSADRSWSVGTVTSVGLNSTTSGVTITNTPVTGSGALTINIATASGSQNGLLSSTDWTTFNNKQNALTNPVTGTGTSGQVAFFNGTSSITGGQLFWDVSNTRLGINKSVPTTTLDVNGGANINGNIIGVDNIVVNGSGGQGGTLSIQQFNSSLAGRNGYTTINALGQNQLQVNFSQASAVRIATFDSSSITDNANRVYTLPNASGTLALTSNINSAVSGSTGQVAYFNGTNSVTGESNLFWDAANDRLGIGINIPLGRLHVASGNAHLNNYFTTGTSAGWDVKTYFTGGGSGSEIGLYLGYSGVDNDTYILRGSNGRLEFGTAATPRMVLNASGNLGLGVTPSAWFSDRRAIQVQSGGSVNGSASTPSFVELGANFFHGSGGDTYISTTQATKYRQLSGAHEWYTAPSGTAGNAISFTQAMTLDASGRLGIGTGSATPAYRLHVSSNVPEVMRLQGNNTGASNNTQLRFFGSASNADLWAIGTEVSTGTSDRAFDFYDLVAGANRMRITSGGNVGIGTQTPDTNSRLDVNGQTFVGHLAIYNNNGTPSLGTSPMLYSPASGTLAISTNTSERMRITSGGNVGIGTNNPLSFADVLTVHMNGGSSGSFFTMAASGTRHLSIIANSSEGKIETNTNIPIVFATNESEKIRMHANGGLKFAPQSAAPTAEAGTVYYDSDDNKLKVYNGTSWVDLH